MAEKISTQQKILHKAVELFNNKGIEYVGMRELAAVLEMRIGNITYYFATKDDLVFAISTSLAALNSQTIIVDENLSIKGFLKMLLQTFKNHYSYRCLMLSVVHLMKQNPAISEKYKKTQKKRNETWYNNLNFLQKNGFIILKNDADKDFLVSSIALIARFWLSEASVSYSHLSPKKQMQHYLKLIAMILLPYTTEKGKAEIEEFLQKV